MDVPEGYPNPNNKVCKFIKSLYGLKQASRQWFVKLLAELLNKGFHQSKNDYSLFIRKDGFKCAIAAVYVDDIILTGDNLQILHSLKHHLDVNFSVKDLSKLDFFLDIEVGYTPAGITLTQKKFTKKFLVDAGLEFFKNVVTLLPLHIKLTADEGVLYSDRTFYRCMVGKLKFSTHTRPDLSYNVQCLSHYLQHPRVPHFQALMHTLRYVGSTAGQGIILKASGQLSLKAYSDSDWGACPDSRRSITGYVMLVDNSPVSWKSKKQGTVSRSSSEVEYRAISTAASEITWLVRLLEELVITDLKLIFLHCDNQSSIHIVKNPVHHERTKHIEIDVHFTRDKVLEGLLQLVYVPTNFQLVDVFTKVLPSAQFNTLLDKFDMSSPPLSSQPVTFEGDVEHITFSISQV